MEFSYTLSGGAPVIKTYHAGTAISTVGIPILGSVDGATDIGEVEPGTQSTAVNVGSMVGINLDTTAASIAATGMVTADIEIKVIVNPDAVLRAKMAGGTASDTALTVRTVTSASTTGIQAIGCTTFDNGTMWGYTGSQVGHHRVTDDTTGGVGINFDGGILLGDQFLSVHGHKCSVELTNWECYDMTATLDQVNAQLAVTDMDNYATVDMELNASGNNGRRNSYYHLIANNHLFGSSSLA